MNSLPDIALYKIQTIIFEDVISDIELSYKAGAGKWIQPSKRLIDLCQDNGTVQRGCHTLYELIQDHNMHYFQDYCENCAVYKFPCTNCATYVYENSLTESFLPFCN